MPSNIPVITPAQSLEAYQDCVNPVIDVGGLLAVVPELVAMASSGDINASSEQRAQLKFLSAHLAAIPLGTVDQLNNCPPEDWSVGSCINTGEPVVLPAYNCSGGTGAGTVGFKRGGPESPMLYPWFPFRLFGAGRKNLWSPLSAPLSLARANQLGRATWKARNIYGGDWDQGLLNAVLTQQPIDEQAAMLLQRARGGFSSSFRFPFATGDCSGSGVNSELGAINANALQWMIAQDGANGEIVMFPSGWPAGWDLSFKLHTQNATTVSGRCSGGKLRDFVVRPAWRASDVSFGAGGAGCSR